MKIKLLYTPFILFVVVNLISCHTDDVIPGKNVEFYLLKSFENIDNSCQINESTVVLMSDPLLRYTDLLIYDPNEYTYQLSSKAKDAINALDFPTSGLPFAVTVDGEIIYTAYFWPSYSSMSCQWAVTDPFLIDFNNGLKIELGYPGRFDGVEIPDKRNDPHILAVLRKDGKLAD